MDRPKGKALEISVLLHRHGHVPSMDGNRLRERHHRFSGADRNPARLPCRHRGRHHAHRSSRGASRRSPALDDAAHGLPPIASASLFFSLGILLRLRRGASGCPPCCSAACRIAFIILLCVGAVRPPPFLIHDGASLLRAASWWGRQLILAVQGAAGAVAVGAPASPPVASLMPKPAARLSHAARRRAAPCRLGIVLAAVKPMAVVGLYSFHRTGCASTPSRGIAMALGNSGLGCVFAAAVVYVGISVKRGEFRSSVCKLRMSPAHPLARAVPSVHPIRQRVPRASSRWEATRCLIVIMVILRQPDVPLRHERAVAVRHREGRAPAVPCRPASSARGMFDHATLAPARRVAQRASPCR